MHKLIEYSLKQVKRFVVAIIGSTVIIIGVLMIATPGPAILVIPLGLGILATEFIWARQLLKKVKARIAATVGKNNNKSDQSDTSD